MLLAISQSDTHTHRVQHQQLHAFCQHCTMSMFWQLFRPALARKAGQRDPQTLVGGLGADHGTSRSKSGKKFSPSAMTLRTQAASACDKWHPCTYSTSIFSKVAAACTPSSARAMHQRGTVMQPLQCVSAASPVAKHSSKTMSRWHSEIRTIHYDSQLSAAKDNNLTQRAIPAARNLDAAMTMRFPASRGKAACLHTHGNKTWQQSCGHSTAICNHRFQNTL